MPTMVMPQGDIKLKKLLACPKISFIWHRYNIQLHRSLILHFLKISYFLSEILRISSNAININLENFYFFRWGTHLYMTLFPSIHLSITHHISETVQHLIIIFGTHMLNNDISRRFFIFKKNFAFLDC